MSATCAHRTVQRPETREIIPRTAWPNFRDHAKSVDATLLRVLCNLQRAHGWSYVTEAGLRKMICEDLGHMPGTDTVRRALDRLAGQGLLHQVWLLKGGLMPDGTVSAAGVRLIRVAVSRSERASFLGRVRKGREKTTGRVHHRALFDLMTAQKVAPPPPPANDTARALEQRRSEAIAAAQELARRFALEDGLDPPA